MSYVDSRGVAMDDMPFSAAIERVHALASGNLPDEHDISREGSLVDERFWQQQALDTVEDLLVNLHEELDEAFQPPSEYGEWPVEVTQPNRDDDPSNPVFAIRIVLQMAMNVLPAAAGIVGVEAADQYDLDTQSIELVEDFIALHGEELEEKIRVIRMPTLQ